jgi:hypothetical protein
LKSICKTKENHEKYQGTHAVQGTEGDKNMSEQVTPRMEQTTYSNHCTRNNDFSIDTEFITTPCAFQLS